MTKQEVISKITEVANEYDFKVEENNWATYGFSIKPEQDFVNTVNFTVSDRFEFNIEAKEVTHHVEVRASIATMGGNPTADDLLKQAQIIWNAGSLVKALENEDLTWVEQF